MSNPIIIRRRVQRDFTILPNDVVRDPRLSWKALGLLVYVLSLPDDFRLHLKYLANQKPTGRDGTRAGLKELEQAGYLTIRRERRAGRFAQVIWDITDAPIGGIPTAKPPCSENPNTVNLNTALPNPQIPTLQRTSSKQEPIYKEPTTTDTTRSIQQAKDENPLTDLVDLTWPSMWQGKSMETAKQLLRDCHHTQRQPILDEIAGLTDRGTVRHPIGLLRKLIERANHGQFFPAAALDYQRKRESQVKADQTRTEDEQSEQQSPPLMGEIARKKLASMRRQLRGGAQ